MKRSLLLALLTCCISTAYAQEKLNAVASPTSPASSILGMQPTAILAPKSYQALEAALYSNFMDNSRALIPNDFALEFTPYWATNHSLSLEEYLYPKSTFEQIRRTSSFSLASTQNFLLGDSSATTGLALGYRTTIYFGNNKDREKIEDYRKQLAQGQKISARIIAQAEKLVTQAEIKEGSDFLRNIRSAVTEALYMASNNKQHAEAMTDEIYRSTASLPAFNKNNPDDFLDAFYNLIDQQLESKTVFDQFKDYVRNRYGFSLDIAYAALLSFPTNDFSFSIVPRQSIWLTPTYSFKDKLSFLKVMGVLRYEYANTAYYRRYFPQFKYYNNNIDYGVAVAGAFQKFSIQFEVAGRSGNTEIPAGSDVNGNQLYLKDQRSDIQYIGTFSYRLTDQVALTYSLGNRFQPVFNPGNLLVSLLSLNLGFGAPDRSDIVSR